MSDGAKFGIALFLILASLIGVGHIADKATPNPPNAPKLKVQFDDAAMKGWIEANLSDALAERGLHVYCVLQYTNVGDTVVISRGTALIIASSREEAECLFSEGKMK